MRSKRRAEIVAAFARVLADQGFAGATIAAVAAEAGVAPGLVHHYFTSKDELLECLLEELMVRFRRRTHALDAHEGPLAAYADAAVRLDATADTVAARCWVGVLAEAVRTPTLFSRIRRLLDGEIEVLRRRSSNRLTDEDSGAVLAFILGALVLGAFAPRKTAGFAGPGLEKLIAALVQGRAAAR